MHDVVSCSQSSYIVPPRADPEQIQSDGNTGRGTGGGEREFQEGIKSTAPLPREVGDATRTWGQPLQYHNFARGQSNTLEELAQLITHQKDKQLVDSPIR